MLFAGHELEEIGDVYINDEVVDLNSKGEGSSSRWWGENGEPAVFVSKFDGTNNAGAFKPLRDACPNWTVDHKLEGFSGVYVRLAFDSKVFPRTLKPCVY